MTCDINLRQCSGKFAVAFATGTTGIYVRDKHFRKLLQTDVYPVATLEITKAPNLALNNADSIEITGALGLAGGKTSITMNAKCSLIPNTQGYACSFDHMQCDICQYGISAPTFLGIEVNPLVQISGNFFLRESSN